MTFQNGRLQKPRSTFYGPRGDFFLAAPCPSAALPHASRARGTAVPFVAAAGCALRRSNRWNFSARSARLERVGSPQLAEREHVHIGVILIFAPHRPDERVAARAGAHVDGPRRGDYRLLVLHDDGANLVRLTHEVKETLVG